MHHAEYGLKHTYIRNYAFMYLRYPPTLPPLQLEAVVGCLTAHYLHEGGDVEGRWRWVGVGVFGPAHNGGPYSAVS